MDESLEAAGFTGAEEVFGAAALAAAGELRAAPAAGGRAEPVAGRDDGAVLGVGLKKGTQRTRLSAAERTMAVAVAYAPSQIPTGRTRPTRLQTTGTSLSPGV